MSEDSRPHRYGWPEYEKLVLSSLKRVESEIELIKDKLHELLADDLGRLKTDIALLGGGRLRHHLDPNRRVPTPAL